MTTDDKLFYTILGGACDTYADAIRYRDTVCPGSTEEPVREIRVGYWLEQERHLLQSMDFDADEHKGTT